MDLGISGRKAIVCASSKGLGKGLRRGFGRGRLRTRRQRPQQGRACVGGASDSRTEVGVVVHEVVGDLNDPATRAALIAACPEADILVNNNGGPPFKAFDAITREDILAGVEANMLTPDRPGSGASAGHGEAKVRPDHQHHLRVGARADRRARRLVGRAGRADRLPGVRGPGACGAQRDDQFDPAGRIRHRPLAVVPDARAPPSAASRSIARGPRRKPAFPRDASATRPSSARSARFSRAPGRVHHRSEHPDRRRRVPRRFLNFCLERRNERRAGRSRFASKPGNA